MMNTTTMRTAVSAATIATGMMVFGGGVTAQDSAEARGRAIAEEADQSDYGWGDNSSTMRMVLRNRNGDESVRELRRRALETEEAGSGDMSVITFDAPRDDDWAILVECAGCLIVKALERNVYCTLDMLAFEFRQREHLN